MLVPRLRHVWVVDLALRLGQQVTSGFDGLGQLAEGRSYIIILCIASEAENLEITRWHRMPKSFPVVLPGNLKRIAAMASKSKGHRCAQEASQRGKPGAH